MTLPIMKLLLFTTVLVVCMQMGLGKTTREDEESLNTEIESRFIFNSGSGSTSVDIGNIGFIQLGAAALVPLIIGGALLLYLFVGDEESGGYSSSGSGHRSIGQKFSPYGFNWESLSILDWIAMGQEAWEKYDPYNLECQKRLICEIHQNESKFGGAANTMVQLFGYLQYAETFSLPEELKLILEEYIDASEKGKTMQKDCGEVYEACDFSVNRIVTKFSTNDI